MSNIKDLYLTVGQLKKALEGVPDDTKVYYQRIEDQYFDKYGWKPKLLTWEPGEKCEYIQAWSAYKCDDSEEFVINAHY